MSAVIAAVAATVHSVIVCDSSLDLTGWADIMATILRHAGEITIKGLQRDEFEAIETALMGEGDLTYRNRRDGVRLEFTPYPDGDPEPTPDQAAYMTAIQSARRDARIFLADYNQRRLVLPSGAVLLPAA